MSQLIAIETLNPIEIFSNNGLEKIIDRIEKDVSAIAIDMTTEQGRKEIDTTAKKINRSKTLLDDMGKTITEDWMKKKAAVDVQRRQMRDRLDQIKDTFRKPLTDFENAEKLRVEELQSRLNEINNYLINPLGAHTQEEINIQIERIQNTSLDNWQEFTQAATTSKEKAIAFWMEELNKRIKFDQDQAELEALREQQREQREKQIAEDAAKAERDRIASEKKKEDDETARREADRNHKARVNNEILSALVGLPLGVTEEQYKEIIAAIIKGLIPNLKINY